MHNQYEIIIMQPMEGLIQLVKSRKACSLD